MPALGDVVCREVSLCPDPGTLILPKGRGDWGDRNKQGPGRLHFPSSFPSRNFLVRSLSLCVCLPAWLLGTQGKQNRFLGPRLRLRWKGASRPSLFIFPF